MSFPLRIRAVPRDRVPTEDEVRDRLVRLLRDQRGPAPELPVVVVVRERTVDSVDPRPALEAGVTLPRLVAMMAGSSSLPGGAALAVGLVGRLTFRPHGGEPRPVAVAFLEWADNRWWHWQAELDAQGAVVEGSAVVRRAEAGAPLPDGLGRWWADARRRNLRLTLQPMLPANDGGIEH